MKQANIIGCLAIIVLVSCGVPSANAEETLWDIVKDAKKDMCLTNESCYKSFFEINNYCCAIRCCNIWNFVKYDGYLLKKLY